MPYTLHPVPAYQPSFAGFPRCRNLEELEADVAIIGIPYTSLYGIHVPPVGGGEETGPPGQEAAAALRRQSQSYALSLGNYDFDFDGDLFAGREVHVADCGDVAMAPADRSADLQSITEAIRNILERGAVPIVLGGDHGTPIPVLRAYEGRGSLCVVQIDAHMDFRDEREGFREGYSSQMRRAAEMPWVSGLMQIGLRGVGSGRREEYEAARGRGSVLVRAQELHEAGVARVLRRLPRAEQYYITIDADGLDPAIAPGVFYPSPGGVDYFEMTEILKGVARRGRICGLDLCEVVPALDLRELTAIFGSRLILNAIGAMARAGQFNRLQSAQGSKSAGGTH
jgi:agmatinase